MNNIINEVDLILVTRMIKDGELAFRAINHKLRCRLLKLIHQRGKMTVTEIYVQLDIDQSIASQHLGILRREGLVKVDRAGNCVYYSLNYLKLLDILDSAGRLNVL